MQSKYFVFSLIVAAGIVACKKEQISPLPLKEITNSANVKIVHASAYNTNYTVQLKLNNSRISNAFTYSTPFPGGGLNTGGSNFPWYLALTPGTLNLSMTVPKVGTSTDSIALYSGTANVEANKFYSIYLSDTATNTQTTVVTENTTLPDQGLSRYKFINLMPNTTALDLYVGGTIVASNIAYKAVSPEFTLRLGDSARLYIRVAGTLPTSAPIATYPTIPNAPMTVPNKRLLTVFARGYSGATVNRAPNISLLYN